MIVEPVGAIDLTDSEGALLLRPTVQLSPEEAQALRSAARMLRAKRFRLTIRCDACFESGRGDGMRGEITRAHIQLECRCRHLQFRGASV